MLGCGGDAPKDDKPKDIKVTDTEKSSAPVCAFADIAVNEIHPDGEPEDYIELINLGGSACSLEGWELHDAKTHVDGMSYDEKKAEDILKFGAIEIAAGAIWFGEAKKDASFGFGIGKGGEQVILVAPGSQKTIHYIHAYEVEK